MLSLPQMGVFAALCLGDFLLLAAILDARRRGSLPPRKRYPKRAFLLHALGGFFGIVLGGLAVVAGSVGLDAVASVAGIGQGLTIALLAGISALPLSRHTSGYKGFNTVGYALYAVGWMVSGMAVVQSPGIHTAYACFVLTHAFLTCRLFVYGLPPIWRWWTGQEIDGELNYSLATTFAALVPLVLAWHGAGFLLWAWVTTLSLLLHLLGVSSPWHARYEPSDSVLDPLGADSTMVNGSPMICERRAASLPGAPARQRGCARASMSA